MCLLAIHHKLSKSLCFTSNYVIASLAMVATDFLIDALTQIERCWSPREISSSRLKQLVLSLINRFENCAALRNFSIGESVKNVHFSIFHRYSLDITFIEHMQINIIKVIIAMR